MRRFFSGRTRFVIAGFQKCGTTGLARLLQKSCHINICHDRDGNLEYPLFRPDLRTDWPRYDKHKINGHKYSSYIRSRKTLFLIRLYRSDMLVIVCVRDPRRVLLSWHNMHRQMARDGAPGHFTNASERARAFFAECDVETYYRAWARPRLRFADILAKSGLERGAHLITDQKFLQTDPQAVFDAIHLRLGKTPPALPEQPPIRTVANRLDLRECLTRETFAELSDEFARLKDYLGRSNEAMLSPEFRS